VACVNLDQFSNGELILLPKCQGLFTGRQSQSAKGACVDVEVHTPPLEQIQESPYLASNIYLNTRELVPGKYYFDCHTLDGIIISREVIVCKYDLLLASVHTYNNVA